MVLERDLEPVDRVRGEFMAPWGVAEASRLGLLDVLLSTGGVYATRGISYDENTPPERAEASALDLRAVHRSEPARSAPDIQRCAPLSRKRPFPKGPACCVESGTLPLPPDSHLPSNSNTMGVAGHAALA